MAANDDLEQKLKAGVDAARRGDRTTARRLLEQVVTLDENNELAWIWLASSVNTLGERRACLERVLQINPGNTRAREALQKLMAEDHPQAGTDSNAAERIRRIEQAQQSKSPRSTPRVTEPVTSTGSGFNYMYLIVGGLIVISIGIAAVFGSSLIQQLQPPSPTQAAVLAPTLTETPAEPSATATIHNVAGTRTVPTLPPTFTPSPTASPTVSPTPTSTPYPLANFMLYFTVLRPGDVEPTLYSMGADGSNIQMLAQAVRAPAIDPTGKQIAFVRDVTIAPDGRSPDGGTWPEIFIAPLNNLDAAQQITDLRHPIVAGLSWAPDSLQLVFSSDFDGDEELWAMTSDGLNVRQLTFNEGADRDPAWAPGNSSRIIFASDLDTPGLTEIYDLRLDPAQGDEHTITRLTNDNGSSYVPSWAADGSQIAFISDRGGDGDVFVMDQSGQRPLLLTFDDGAAEDRQAIFSPDQRWVFFVSNREEGIFQIYLVNLRGSELVRIANIDGDVQNIAFRPEPLLGVR